MSFNLYTCMFKYENLLMMPMGIVMVDRNIRVSPMDVYP